jgi:hypothetical protein
MDFLLAIPQNVQSKQYYCRRSLLNKSETERKSQMELVKGLASYAKTFKTPKSDIQPLKCNKIVQEIFSRVPEKFVGIFISLQKEG